MHSSADYLIGRTRVLNNPHGYGRENAGGFDPALILDANSICSSALTRHSPTSLTRAESS